MSRTRERPTRQSGPAPEIGSIWRRPDGRVIVLENQLPDGTWGADMLEDAEGRPDPNGFPGCYGLVVDVAMLTTYWRMTPRQCKRWRAPGDVEAREVQSDLQPQGHDQ